MREKHRMIIGKRRILQPAVVSRIKTTLFERKADEELIK
jgi:hypothetical protein